MTKDEEKEIDQSKMTISEEVVIKVEQMNKWFGHFHVLRDINLTVNKGERTINIISNTSITSMYGTTFISALSSFFLPSL